MTSLKIDESQRLYQIVKLKALSIANTRYAVFYTVCAVHLADIKFGELECKANWRTFSLQSGQY